MTNALRCIIAGLAVLFAGCAVNTENGKMAKNIQKRIGTTY
jgi:hypothetical protein